MVNILCSPSRLLPQQRIGQLHNNSTTAFVSVSGSTSACDTVLDKRLSSNASPQPVGRYSALPYQLRAWLVS
jgi:hypothetical protein